MTLQNELDWVCRPFEQPLPINEVNECLLSLLPIVEGGLEDVIARQREKLRAKLAGKSQPAGTAEQEIERQRAKAKEVGQREAAAHPSAPDDEPEPKEDPEGQAEGRPEDDANREAQNRLAGFKGWLDDLKGHYPKTAKFSEVWDKVVDAEERHGPVKVVAAVRKWATQKDGILDRLAARQTYATDEYKIAGRFVDRLNSALGISSRSEAL